MNQTSSTTSQRHQNETRMLAHHLWQQAGCPANQDFHFWLQAERQLFGDHREQTKPVAASNGRKQPAAPKAAGTANAGAKRAASSSGNSRRKSQSGTVRAATRAQ